MIAWWWTCVSLAAGVFIGFVLAALLIQELAQYKDIEEEEDQLKRIIGV